MVVQAGTIDCIHLARFVLAFLFFLSLGPAPSEPLHDQPHGRADPEGCDPILCLPGGETESPLS